MSRLEMIPQSFPVSSMIGRSRSPNRNMMRATSSISMSGVAV